MSREPSLEETFLAQYGRGPVEAGALMSAAVGSAAPRPAPLRRRIYGFGSVFGKTLRDSRRAILLVGGVLALLLIGVSSAIIAEFSTPAARHELETVVAAVPPILQGLAGSRRQCRDAGWLPLLQVRHVLPADRQPVVDPRAVGDACRGGPPRQPRVRRRGADVAPAGRAREARRSPDGDGDRDPARVPGAADGGPHGHVARRRDLIRVGGRLRAVAGRDLPGRRRPRIRCRPIRRSRLGDRHRRRGHVRRLHPQRLPQRHPGTSPRSPT